MTRPSKDKDFGDYQQNESLGLFGFVVFIVFIAAVYGVVIIARQEAAKVVKAEVNCKG